MFSSFENIRIIYSQGLAFGVRFFLNDGDIANAIGLKPGVAGKSYIVQVVYHIAGFVFRL